MALTHWLNELDLLAEWGYRDACVRLSQLGYRKREAPRRNGAGDIAGPREGPTGAPPEDTAVATGRRVATSVAP